VASKNIAVAIGFGVITVLQLALGLCLVAFAAGESKSKPWGQKNCASSRVCRPTAPTDTL